MTYLIPIKETGHTGLPIIVEALLLSGPFYFISRAGPFSELEVAAVVFNIQMEIA